MMYTHLDAGQYTTLRKELLRRRGSGLQQNFIEAALSNEEVY